MAHTSAFRLAVVSVVLFGLLTADASSEFDEGNLVSQLEDNPFEDFELRYYGHQQSNGFCAGKRDGNYVNPSNPHSFYQCHQNGVTLLRYCDSRTVYDPPPRDRCEWPDQVRGCNGRYGNCSHKEPIIVLPTIPPPDYGRDGECSNRPQCKSCKPPTLPSYQPQVSSRRNARETRQSEENPAGESEIDLRYYANRFCAGKKDGNYVNPTNPHSLYQCHQNGALNELACTGGTVYDPPPADRCEWPNKMRGCNGGYGRGCHRAPIIATTEVYKPAVTTKPVPRQCNAICTTHMPKSPEPYVIKYHRHDGYSG